MSRFAVAAVLPDTDPIREHVVTQEFDTWDEVPAVMAELEATFPAWRAVTFVHVEDLPAILTGYDSGGSGTLTDHPEAPEAPEVEA